VNKRPPVQYDVHEVVDACFRAAWELRSRPGRVASERAQQGSLLAELLDAVGSALAIRPASVPEGVKRAALRVAQDVRATHDRDAWVCGHYDRDGGCGEVRADADLNVVDRDNAPFTASIRLGRMG
jgi:hypothetical protein